MISCIIIEDQPPAQRVLQKYISDMETLELKDTFADALNAIDYLRTASIDLIFLDIHLPKISGIDFLKTLSTNYHVILTTAFGEYALESYEYQVTDYLLKPFSFERFVKAVSNVPSVNTANGTTTEQKNTTETFFIKSGYEHLKIKASDILYIHSEADYTEIITTDKKHLTSNSLKYWLQQLDDKRFTQVHKSYVVNTENISKISGNRIYFSDAIYIPIGRAYKEEFIKRFIE